MLKRNMTNLWPGGKGKEKSSHVKRPTGNVFHHAQGDDNSASEYAEQQAMVENLSAQQLNEQFEVLLVRSAIDWLIDWFACWLISRLIDWLIACLFNESIDRSIDWLVD